VDVTRRARAQDATKVRETVEGILAEVEARGDAAVRELSNKFDNWDREDYRLTDAKIRDCLGQLSQRNVDDIRYAQAQVRAQFRRTSASRPAGHRGGDPAWDRLGHKNIPVNSVGCYVPGGKYPLLPSAYMSVISAKVAGVRASRPTPGRRNQIVGEFPRKASE